MFTSRSEFRLSVRAENADFRLTPYAIDMGIIQKEQENVFKRKLEMKLKGM